MKKRGKKIFSRLAAVLDYPSRRTIESVIECSATLDGAAKLRLDEFREFCLTNPLDRLQGVYRETFQNQAACCPYVGHHLFDKDRSRKLFMAKLKEHYGVAFVSRDEMPDHITVMLRSLGVQESVEEARELIGYCLIPAIKKMIPLMKNADNPYKGVLEAVLLTLETEDKMVLAP